MATSGAPASSASAASSRLRRVSPERKLRWTSTNTESGPNHSRYRLSRARGLLPAAVERQVGERSVAAAGQQDHAAGVLGQVGGVEPGLPPVGGVGQGEEPGDVGVALPRRGQQDETGAVGECQLAPGNRPDTEAVGETGELQRPAEVGVGEG